MTTAEFLILHPNGEEAVPRSQVQLELNRLEQMVAYCKTQSCLRGFILDYFGQKHEPQCGNCGLLGEITRNISPDRWLFHNLWVAKW